MKLDLIIQDEDDHVHLVNVDLADASIIIEYAFHSGYEVLIKNHEAQ